MFQNAPQAVSSFYSRLEITEMFGAHELLDITVGEGGNFPM
jgi:hypothetical protein